MSISQPQVTQLLNRAAGGDPSAARALMPLIYEDLRRLAGGMMAKLPPGQTLQPTALVHEAYLRLVGRDDLTWRNRGEYFFLAARAMHDIIVEQARRKSRRRHGGDVQRVEMEELPFETGVPSEDILALEIALARIRDDDPDGHRIVMLRYFAGLTIPEIADVMGTSVRTIERRWRYLRAVLAKEMHEGRDRGPQGV